MRSIRYKAILASGLASLLLLSTGALAAGTYDGTWTGSVTDGGCAGTVVTIAVADNMATTYFTGTGGVRATFHARPISSDGTVSWVTVGKYASGRMSKITFTGNKFEMVSNAKCGHLSVTGSKQ